MDVKKIQKVQQTLKYLRDPNFAMFVKFNEVSNFLNEKNNTVIEKTGTLSLDEEKIIKEVLRRIELPEKGKDADNNYIFSELVKVIPNFIPSPIPGKDADEKKITSKVLKTVRAEIDESKDEIKSEILSEVPSRKEIDISIVSKIEELKPEPININEIVDIVKKKIGTATHSGYKMRGGGDTIVAGSNVTITANPEGTKTISVPSIGWTIETPTGTLYNQDTGTDGLIFTSTATATAVFVDGATYFDGCGCTISGTTITLDNPATQFIRVAI